MPITYAQAVVFVPDGRVLLVKSPYEKNSQWHATLDTHIAVPSSPRYEILDALKEDLNIVPGKHNTVLEHEFSLTAGDRILQIFSMHLRKSVTLITDDTFPLMFAAITFSKLIRWIKSETGYKTRSFSINTRESIMAMDETLGKTITKGCYLR